ncbi:MAG: peptide chain release factor N(5)-glutamine methyltransferase [Bacteroidales bacterium]
MNQYSIYKTYKNLVAELSNTYSKREAESLSRILIEHISGYKPHQIITSNETTLSSTQFNKMQTSLSQLKLQKPIQYILGQAEFFGINIDVNENVLIPRPETEELVQWVISENNLNTPRILDIGTGSGCIAIALAKHIPNAKVFAIDYSAGALKVAEQNAKINEVDVTFFECDILNTPERISGSPFDIIISNPPYVRESEKALMQANVLDNEPELALFVKDNNPLIFYEAIVKFATSNLKPCGKVYCEINEALGKQTKEVFLKYGFNHTEIRKDINSKDRMLKCSH